MRIEQRIKIIQDRIKNDISLQRFIQLIQVEPNSKKYNATETFKNTSKTYIVNNIDEFIQKQDKNTHILRIDIVDNSHLEKYLYMTDEEG